MGTGISLYVPVFRRRGSVIYELALVGEGEAAESNVTFNYFRLFDFESLNGKTVAATLSAIKKAVSEFGTEKCSDYWATTPGNVGYFLSVLSSWADKNPDGVWCVGVENFYDLTGIPKPSHRTMRKYRKK